MITRSSQVYLGEYYLIYKYYKNTKKNKIPKKHKKAQNPLNIKGLKIFFI